MKLAGKTLWVIDLNSPRDARALANNALAIGAGAVCIRTTTKHLAAVIPEFHALGIKVYGWRWPAVVSGPHKAPHYFAEDEARHVVEVLIPAGLDGYIVDPESDAAGDCNDWNQSSLERLAADFCSTIRNAAQSDRPFLFCTTSGCIYPSAEGKPAIPWRQFFDASDVLVPQAYWRRRMEDGTHLEINGGGAREALDCALDAWRPMANGCSIAPMAGEIDIAKPAEIADFGWALNLRGIRHAHFYAASTDVDSAILAAIRSL